jgi:hypothetical protein
MQRVELNVDIINHTKLLRANRGSKVLEIYNINKLKNNMKYIYGVL